MSALGEKPYRAHQLIKWIHDHQVIDFDAMTTFSKDLRAKLKEVCTITLPQVIADQLSTDGTRKWLFQLGSHNGIETVYIPDRERGTLCISSQVGCSLNCSFCSTGAQGFSRNLSTAEIIGQVFLAKQCLLREDPPRAITNVVFMGMGEPLLNYDPVLRTIRLLLNDYAYNLSKYRVTLSTSGIVPQLQQLSLDSDVALAISLHAPTDELRDVLVPINKKYNLKLLLDTCRAYYKDRGENKRYITMEYVMLNGVNDSDEHARALVRLLKDIRCKVNLIPFNPFPQTRYTRSPQKRIDAFQRIVMDGGLMTLMRRTRGEDIDAACGQLAGEFKDRTRRRELMERKNNLMRDQHE